MSSEIEKYKTDIAEITKAKENAEKNAEQYRLKADSYEYLNKNLIRIATERANAKRQLIPKKQHTGYIFLLLEEYAVCFGYPYIDLSDETFDGDLPCIRILVQTPYETSFDLRSVQIMIYKDVDTTIGKKIGINTIYRNDAFQSFTEKEYRAVWNKGANENEKENFIFRTRHIANFTSGFWEVEYLTRYFVNIPPEMIKVSSYAKTYKNK